jgi:hypothetical protein
MDGRGTMQFYRAPFYETIGFTGLFIGLSLLVFIGVFLRLAYQWGTYRSLQPPEKSAHRASIAVALFNVVFFVLFGLAMRDQQALMYEIPLFLKIALVFPILAAFAAVYHVYQLLNVWRHGLLRSVWTRMRYGVITFCAVFMVWFYYYWNFLGFNYFT